MIAPLLAVSLRVAFVGRVLTLTDTMNRAFDDLFASAYEGTDAFVRSDRTVESQFEGMELRARLDTDLVEVVESVDGVAAVDVTVEGYARIIEIGRASCRKRVKISADGAAMKKK